MPLGSLKETESLVEKTLEGDGEARGELLERLRPRLVLWSASRMSPTLRAKIDPEDMAQEILMALHKAIDDFEGDPGPAFRGWLFRVAENRIRDAAKHWNAAKRKTITRRPFTQTSPSGAAARKEAVTRLREAMDKLPEDYRRVIQLRRLEERDTDEVAELMERTENAIRILYFRAVRALREGMEG
jgi:RNA polymerase sigma-70 factor, ECF subfamily